MKSLRLTSSNGKKTVSPSGPARSDTGPSPCFRTNNPEHFIKFCVVDDDWYDRLHAKRTLEKSGGFVCAGLYANGSEALSEIPLVIPDVVLMDIRMPGISGIESMRRLKGKLPGLLVILVSGLHDRQTISAALAAGGDGYLTKPFTVAQCLATITFAFRQRRPMTQSGGSLLLPVLNQRENVVMEYLAHGLPNKQIADRLNLSVDVVNYVVRRICEKLGAANRAEAVSRRQTMIATSPRA